MSRSPRARDVARRFPVTLGIATLTLIFFGVEQTSGGATDVLTHLRFGALRTERLVEHGEYYRLFMPLLLHHGWIHLLLNGFAFLQLGALVEALWGGRRLLLFYVVCGLAASLTSATLNGITMPASVGASGAILGLAGLILGTTWYGQAPIRGWLLDLVGRRLLYSVLLTFAIGFGLWLILPLVDNWAHVGGFVCGLLLAAATPDPSAEVVERTLPAAAAAGVALLASVGWALIDGDEVLEHAELDIARSYTVTISEQPIGWQTLSNMVQMLEWYERADALDEGHEVFERNVARLREPQPTEGLVMLLAVQQHQQDRDRDHAILLASERWVQLAPDDPDALNALAWQLATLSDPAQRDLARAEALSRQSLELLRDDPVSEAMFLDTLGEILFQEGELDEALEAQRRSVQLAQQAGEPGWFSLAPRLPLDEIEARLKKIEEAAARG